jgi:hypothetical protein
MPASLKESSLKKAAVELVIVSSHSYLRKCWQDKSFLSLAKRRFW